MFGVILLEFVGFVFVLWLVMRRESKTAIPIPILVLLVALLIAFGMTFVMALTATGPLWLIVPIRIVTGISTAVMLVMVKLNWPSRVKARAEDGCQGSNRSAAIAAKRSP